MTQTRAGGCQPRRCLHHGHVDRVRALRAAKDQNPCAASASSAPTPGGPAVAKNSGRTGLPLTNAFAAEERLRRLERHRRRADHAREQPVGQARHRVLLEQHRRHAAQRRDAARPDPSCSRRRRSPDPAAARETIRHASTSARAAAAPAPRSRAASDLPFSPPLRIRSSAKPFARHHPRLDARAPCRRT